MESGQYHSIFSLRTGQQNVYNKRTIALAASAPLYLLKKILSHLFGYGFSEAILLSTINFPFSYTVLPLLQANPAPFEVYFDSSHK